MSEKTSSLFKLYCPECKHIDSISEFKMIDVDSMLLECPCCGKLGYFT